MTEGQYAPKNNFTTSGVIAVTTAGTPKKTAVNALSAMAFCRTLQATLDQLSLLRSLVHPDFESTL